jgi:predicted lipid-binding transport protein (Tim44 family)
MGMQHITTREFDAGITGLQQLIKANHAENSRRLDEMTAAVQRVNGTVRRHDTEIAVLETRAEDAETTASRRGGRHGASWGAVGGLIGGILSGLLTGMAHKS